MSRAVRGARPGGPLRPRRRSDRVADLAAWLLSVAVLVVLAAALAIGLESFGALSEQARAEERDRTAVAAVVLADGGIVPEAASTVAVPVRWTEADGIERTGTAEVHGPVVTGDPTEVWVTGDHRLVGPPLTRGDAAIVAAMTAAVVLAVGEVAVWLLGRLAFAGVSRLRDGEWERAWAQTAPRWTRR